MCCASIPANNTILVAIKKQQPIANIFRNLYRLVCVINCAFDISKSTSPTCLCGLAPPSQERRLAAAPMRHECAWHPVLPHSACAAPRPLRRLAVPLLSSPLSSPRTDSSTITTPCGLPRICCLNQSVCAALLPIAFFCRAVRMNTKLPLFAQVFPLPASTHQSGPTLCLCCPPFRSKVLRTSYGSRVCCVYSNTKKALPRNPLPSTSIVLLCFPSSRPTTARHRHQLNTTQDGTLHRAWVHCPGGLPDGC